ncbi:hypothetical protein [Aestuariivirga sp.]|uniref:hypothetical protein n=1 Tax=Aestuariivirga sp. TaxID=2650926 RepID=UPI0039E61C69
MTDFNKHFHTTLRPLDRNGRLLQPLDLVILGSIPEHYWSDPDFRGLQDYGGKYGMVVYFDRNTPFDFGRKDHLGWVSPDGANVCVLTTKIADDAVYPLEFWLPANTLAKIPYNTFIANLFADYPWLMGDEDGPGDHPFIVRGMEQFEHIERILNTPYEALTAAHERAMRVMDNCT